MNADIKGKWLQALRGGKYKQRRHGLREDGGYCCLGVLCDIVAPDEWKPESWGEYSHAGEMLYPGAAVAGEAELREVATRHLMFMNDAEDESFATIADWIEANL